MMKLLGILCIILTASQQAECGKNLKHIRQLETKMDDFLVRVTEVRQSLSHLRDDVTSLQEQRNATAGWDPASTRAASSQSGSGAMVCPSGDLEPQMAILAEGFKEEKAALRREVQQQNKDIATIATTVTDINTKLDETLMDQDQAIGNEARRMDDMKVGAMEDISETKKVIVAVNETLHGKYRDAVTQCDTLSMKVNNVETSVKQVQYSLSNFEKNVESNIKQVQDTLSDFEHSILSLKLNLETMELQMKNDKMALGFKLYASSWYKIHKKKRNWSDAQKRCQERGMHLVEVNDKEELKQVAQWLGDIGWLGATDFKMDGNWRWSTSEQGVLSSLWGHGLPDNYGGTKEYCLNSQSSGDWVNDLPCSIKLSFVCELEI